MHFSCSFKVFVKLIKYSWPVFHHLFLFLFVFFDFLICNFNLHTTNVNFFSQRFFWFWFCNFWLNNFWRYWFSITIFNFLLIFHNFDFCNNIWFLKNCHLNLFQYFTILLNDTLMLIKLFFNYIYLFILNNCVLF